ncbi:MAG: ORC1-type DNA replication protein [Candidatus Aenigmarchaeota archaeon]|nr:ORC1-type DNA replication protein [Candidatus Aenigmarchaeota archaeon]
MPPRDILLAEETLFRDDSIFNPDHIPDQFRFREAQLREMTFALKPALRDGRPGNAFLIGPPATGKTTAVRLVFDEMAKETNKVLAVHVNCHMHPSAFKIFSEIHRSVFGMAPPDTGTPLSKVAGDVFTRLSKEGKVLVVALDDINFLFENGTANDILYMILRAHESYKGILTSVFAVATEELLHELDERVRSIFSPVRIDFPEYSGRELRDILARRCEAGLYPDVIPGELLDRIASRSRDLRFGIELVKQSAMAAEADACRRIEEQHVEKALRAMTRHEDVDSGKILLSIVRSQGPMESGKLYELLKREQGMSYTTFYRLLQRLKSEKALAIKPVEKTRGKTSMISAK